jgi:hypothetical protein
VRNDYQRARSDDRRREKHEPLGVGNRRLGKAAERDGLHDDEETGRQCERLPRLGVQPLADAELLVDARP